jgi:ferredoxin
MENSKENSKPTPLICNCDGTMALDGAKLSRACGRELDIHTQLCRAGVPSFEAAVSGGEPLLVCCTQEAPLFEEILGESGADTEITYVNIRERAGWSDEGGAASAKIAALIAEAGIETPPARSLTLTSVGRALIYGRDESALEAASQLAGRLDATVMISGPAEIMPPARTGFPIFAGTITGLSGYLGAFSIQVDGFARAEPASRGALKFEHGRDGIALEFDLVIDMTGGTALISAPEKRDGYLRADPASPVQVQKALFDASDLIGEFDKPIYVEYNENICTHSRNTVTGCNRCIDICPASAIASDGDIVAFDHHLCAGCGGCASVCPTGAVAYTIPSGDVLYQRLRTLLGAYGAAGGADPVLLIHDGDHGDGMIGAMARLGRGLPARVLPFAVNEVTQIGFDILATSIAYGAGRIVVLTPPSRRDELDGLRQQTELMDAALSGLGHGTGRVVLNDETDPDLLVETLYGLDTPSEIPAATFLPMGGKRTLSAMALEHLHQHAPAPVDVLSLPAGAPFGAVQIDVAGCTLCMSCVGTCPTGALIDNPDAPMLRFMEQACVQCGLCRNTCPESVITLDSRFSFTEESRREVTLKEEEPFECIVCGNPFAAKSAIERTIEKLAGHPMFADDPVGLDRLRMCQDCRVTTQITDDQPMAQGTRRLTRTTDDYLAGKVDDDEP